MKYSTADRLLRAITYKPEYTLSWTPAYIWLGTEDLIEVTISATLPDSSDYPAYTRKRQAGGQFQVDLALLAEDGYAEFSRIVLNNLVAWETHEAREFFRIGGAAPFHPHRPDGNNLWAQTAGPQPAERFAAA